MYFFPFTKNMEGEGGEPFDRVFSHQEIVFFPSAAFFLLRWKPVVTLPEGLAPCLR